MRWRRTIYLMLVATIAGFGAAMWMRHNLERSAPEGRTGVRVTRIYSGADGETHAEEVEAKFAGPDAVGLEESEKVPAGSTNFARFHPGFFQDWHHATARRYVITLSGEGEIEMGGGEKIVLEPGSVALVEDMSGKGHITRNVGKVDWTAVFVQEE
jgi:quercetin dioxygenase-like cupin family protein